MYKVVKRIPLAGKQLFNNQKCFFHPTLSKQLKEIVVRDDDKDTTTVEGKYIVSPRQKQIVKSEKEKLGVCPLCALNLNLQHTDVLILSQFVRSDGCMLPKRITGLCNRQQRLVTYLVAMSQKAGLMPNLAPSWSKRDPHTRQGSKKLNRYFDENTLKIYIDKYRDVPQNKNTKNVERVLNFRFSN